MINKNNGEIYNEDIISSGGQINMNDGLLNLNTEKLYKDYCTNNFNENSLMKYENMLNDFKIILKLIESFKNDLNYSDTNLNKNNTINNLIEL